MIQSSSAIVPIYDMDSSTMKPMSISKHVITLKKMLFDYLPKNDYMINITTIASINYQEKISSFMDVTLLIILKRFIRLIQAYKKSRIWKKVKIPRSQIGR